MFGIQKASDAKLLQLFCLLVCVALPLPSGCAPSFTGSPNNGNPVYQLQGNDVTLSWFYNPDRKTVTDVEWSFNVVQLIATKIPSGAPVIEPAYQERVEVSGDATIKLLNIQEKDSGKYECRVSFTTSPRRILDEAELIVVVTPQITLRSSGPITIDEGNTRTLLCVASGNPKPLVTWYRGSTKVQEDSNNSNYTITSATRNHAGTYRCVAVVNVTAPGLSINPAEYTVAVTVRYQPTVTNFTTGTPGNSVVQGTTVTLTCSANGYPAPTYTIKRGNTVVNSVKGKHVIPNIQLSAEADTYSCEPQNSEGTGPTEQLVITVRVPPVFSSQLPTSRTTKTENKTVSYSCSVEAKPAAAIQWILNGQNLTLGTPPYNISSSVAPIINTKLWKTLAYLTVNRVTWRQHGNFSCLAFNNAGKKSQTTELEVRHRPVVQFDDDHPKNLTLAEGATATFFCKTIGNPATQSHKWQFNGNDIPGESCSRCLTTTYTKASVTQADAGWYSCTGTNTLGEGPPAKAQLSIKRVPDAPIDVKLVAFKVEGAKTVSVNVSWTPGYSGGYDQEFTIHYRVKGSGTDFVEQSVGHPDNNMYTVQGLLPETEYEFTVQASNQAGKSQASAPTQVMTPESSLPPDRGIVKAIRMADDPTVILVTWTVTDPAVTTLSLEIQEGGEDQWEPVKGASGLSKATTEFKVTGIKTVKKYRFKMDMRRPGEQNPVYVYSNIVTTAEINTNGNKMDNEKEELSTEAVVGIVIAILVVIILALAVYVLWNKTKGKRKSERFGEQSMNEPHSSEFENEAIQMELRHSELPRTENDLVHLSGVYDEPMVVKVEQSEMEGYDVPTEYSYPEELTLCAHETVPHLTEYQTLDRATMDWEIARNKVFITKVIGEGAFGKVAKATVKDIRGIPGERTVAVKMTKALATESERTDLLSELEIMKRLKPHPHVIKLLGCVTTSDPLMVLIEYIPYGDLLGFLRRSRGLNDKYYKDPDIMPKTTLTSDKLLKFAFEIADGMSFLAFNNIIHRDLAARNVLVGEYETCKVTDFGMARENDYERKSGGRLPVKWTAYEALMYGQYTTKSDVWSYGVLLYEIFTIGGRPYPRENGRQITSFLKQGKRMAKPKHLDNDLYQIMLNCWQENPQDRPTFELLKMIMELMKTTRKELFSWEKYDKHLYENVEV